MIICHCEQATEGEIRRAVREGACHREDVSARCGAGLGCGGCHPAIDALIEEERPAQLIVFKKTG